MSSRELQRLLEEAPFVHALARAVAAGDADDVAQETWVRAMRHGARGPRRPRPWLAAVVRRLAHNVRRGEMRRARHEEAAAWPDAVPSSAELMQREERRRELVAAVDGLPEALRAVVVLRYLEELPPRAIAARLGIPVTTVWNRQRRALALLRQRLDGRHGDARAWLAPLLLAPRPPAAAGGTAASAAPAAVGATMLAAGTKAKVGVVAGVLVLGAIVLWRAGALPSPLPPPAQDAAAPAAMRGEQEETAAETAPKVAMERQEVTAPPPAATTGTLVVTAVHAEDETPVPDLTVLVAHRGIQRSWYPRATTDAHGVARIEGLPAAPVRIYDVRSWTAVRAEVVAGEESAARLALPPGVHVTGVVVDAEGAPVPGAEVFAGNPSAGYAIRDEVLAVTRSDGRFDLRGFQSGEPRAIGARAAGHGTTPVHTVFQQEGTTRELRLELPGPGGAVAGTVIDARGRPVPHALVWAGASPSPYDLAAARPVVLRSDERGRFRAVGLLPGEHPVRVRAAWSAPWKGSCTVEAAGTTAVHVVLLRGLSCAGRVVDASGEPVAGASVSFAGYTDFARTETTSGEDGSFRLEGLPLDGVELRAKHEEAGSASVEIHGGSGDTVRRVIRLQRGLALRGRVVSDEGPVAGARVHASVVSGTEPWYAAASTDDDGAFSVPACPAGAVTVAIHHRDFHAREVEADPRDGEVSVRLERAPERSARIAGTVLGPDGEPVPQTMVSANSRLGERTGIALPDAAGRFEIGPVPPGAWRVSFRAEGQPWTSTDWQRLEPDETLDLGTVTFPVPGTISVRVTGEGPEPHLALCDATFSLWSPVSGPIAPGRHWLYIGGDGVASRMLPVDVESGQESAVEVSPRSGLRRRLVVVAPGSTNELELSVRRDGELAYAAAERGRIRLERELWLAPGSYTAVVRSGPWRGRSEFTVSEGGDVDVRVVLR